MKMNKKGFTLAELLIVIAIIAILIAIAIPVFASQLRAARLATDHANIRSAYAWAQSANLMGQADINGDGVIDTNDKDASGAYKATTVTFGRDGTISSTVTGTAAYTLQVTATAATECLESSPCQATTYLAGISSAPASAHNQDAKITIQYLAKTVGSNTENAWYVVLA